MYAKIHETINSSVLALADKELIGKTLNEKEIEFKVSERFYKGRIVDEKKAVKLLKEHDNANLIGNKAVGIALKNGLIEKNNVIVIEGIKHAQIYLL
ncbi:MAG: DUF424 family protein [archaeon]